MPKREYDACHAARSLNGAAGSHASMPRLPLAAQDGQVGQVGRPANETAVHGAKGRSTSGIQYGPAYGRQGGRSPAEG